MCYSTYNILQESLNTLHEAAQKEVKLRAPQDTPMSPSGLVLSPVTSPGSVGVNTQHFSHATDLKPGRGSV